ncbi:MAG: hypothetical protein ACI9H6_000539 [Patiriisocius sp.]
MLKEIVLSQEIKMTCTLKADLTEVGINTLSQVELVELQKQYIEQRLSQGKLLDGFDNITDLTFAPVLGVLLVAIPIFIVSLDTNPLIAIVLKILAITLYMAALCFVAFGIYDLAFPQRGAKREFVWLVICSVVGIVSLYISMQMGYSDIVWNVILTGLISCAVYSLAVRFRYIRFPRKNFLFSWGSTGGIEVNDDNLPKETKDALSKIKDAFTDTQVYLASTTSWILGPGKGIDIKDESRLHFYEIVRPKGRRNEVVYLPHFWEA